MLIKCPECGHEVSDTAKACPNCGFAVSEYVEKQKVKDATLSGNDHKNSKTDEQITEDENHQKALEEKANEIKKQYFQNGAEKKAIESKQDDQVEGIFNDKESVDKGKQNKIKPQNTEGLSKRGIIILVIIFALIVGFFYYRSYTNSAAYHAKKAAQEIENENYDAAIDLLEYAVDHSDSSDATLGYFYQMGLAYEGMQKYEDAAVKYVQAKYANDSESRILNMAIESVKAGKYNDAISLFKKCNEAYEDNPYYNYALASDYVENGKYSDSLKFWDKTQNILDAQDKILGTYYNYGLDLFTKQDFENAKYCFEKIPDYKDSAEYIKNCEAGIVEQQKAREEEEKEKKKAADFNSVLNYIKNGELNSALSKLETLPEDYVYTDGTSVSALKEKLNNLKKWLPICGTWTATKTYMNVRQTGRYGYWNEWYNNDFTCDPISISCIPNDDGTVNVKVHGSVPKYTSYSSISEGVNVGMINLNTSETMSAPGSIQLDEDTTISLSSKGVSVKYKKVDNTVDVYFTYTYNTSVTFGTRSSAN